MNKKKKPLLSDEALTEIAREISTEFSKKEEDNNKKEQNKRKLKRNASS
ncbi:hypothetical protein [Bacillus massilinigeriensis]|nr:hypothetical protein [Bacillus massilionigeriensis]